MLENIQHTLISDIYIPKAKAKNSNQLHILKYDYGNEEHPNGSLISVQSILTDTGNNSYEKRIQIVFHYEQKVNLVFDNKFLSEFIQHSIKQHIKYIGLKEENVDLPSIADILIFIEN